MRKPSHLKMLVAEELDKWPSFNADAAQEYRAVMSVVRATREYVKKEHGVFCRCAGQDVCPGCKLDRALRRLARLSGSTKR